MNIDWNSHESVVLLNPRMPDAERVKINALLKHTTPFQGHVWLASSGTTSSFKLVGLAKAAILASANAVNDHLQATSTDIWLNPLPDFHVGGLGIWARAYLSRAKVIKCESKWDPIVFHNIATSHGITLSALVPTQVFDLVKQKLQAPKSMRAVIVGGGALSESLYKEAKDLGWPLLPSYGMTECASQIATARIGEGNVLHVLPHLQVKIDDQSRICVSGASLLTVFLTENGLADPKVDGWYKTSDLGVLDHNQLQMLGRMDDFIKVSGELVSMQRLDEILDQLRLKLGTKADTVLVALPDERRGHMIHLAADAEGLEIKALVEEFQLQVLPFEQIQKVHLVDAIPRSALNKVLKKELLSKLS